MGIGDARRPKTKKKEKTKEKETTKTKTKTTMVTKMEKEEKKTLVPPVENGKLALGGPR